MLELFRIGGEIPNKNYIFIGDYVDRGYNSVETFELLICYKLKYPGNITLLRFKLNILEEITNQDKSRKCTDFMMKYFINMEIQMSGFIAQMFSVLFHKKDYLPIAAIIDEKILCIHGGLSP